MNYLADPGGRFSSDTHRRVLGHLSLPTDGFAWTTKALFARMIPDVGTDLSDTDELNAVLGELEAEGFARAHSTSGGAAWQMTQEGFDLLTGPIANEPGEDAGHAELASVSLGGATKLDGPTEIPAEEADAADHTS